MVEISASWTRHSDIRSPICEISGGFGNVGGIELNAHIAPAKLVANDTYRARSEERVEDKIAGLRGSEKAGLNKSLREGGNV